LVGSDDAGLADGLYHCFRCTASSHGSWPALQRATCLGYGVGIYRVGTGRDWLPANVRSTTAEIGLPKLATSGCCQDSVCHSRRISLLSANCLSVCYLVALRISTSKPSGKPECKGLGSLIDFEGFLDTRYAVLCIGTWLAILGLWIPAYYLKPYANSVYPGNKVSDYFLCMLNGSSIIGATFGGFIGDRLGRLNLLWPITLISGCLCLFLWLLGNSMATLIFFVCVYGFLTSNVTALPPSIIGHITPVDKLGARIGAFYSVVAIASLVGTPIGGALITDHDTKDGYRWLVVFSVSYFLSIGTWPMESLTGDRVPRSSSDRLSCSSAGCYMKRPYTRNGRHVIASLVREEKFWMKMLIELRMETNSIPDTGGQACHMTSFKTLALRPSWGGVPPCTIFHIDISGARSRLG